MFRRLPYPPLVAFVLALAPVAASLQANQPAPEAILMANPNADHPAYADLITAIKQTVDQDQMISGVVSAIKRQFASMPEFAEAEADSPGLIEEVAASLRPILTRQNRRVQALYRPEMVALFASSLTPAEARSIAEFRRFDLGRKLAGAVMQAYAPDATLSGIQSETPVTADQVREDISTAVVSGIGQLSPEELCQMGEMVMANPALLKLQQVNPAIQQILVKMENEPLTTEENTAIDEAVEAVFDRRFFAQ